VYPCHGSSGGYPQQEFLALNDKRDSAPSDPVPRAATWRVYDWPGLARSYDFWSALTESRAAARAIEVADFQPGESVLEVAVGTGVMFSKLAQIRDLKHCVGIEPSEAMFDRARRTLPVQLNERTALCRADARQTPFMPQSFDVIVNCYMLDLLSGSDIREVLWEFRRILKLTGRLVLLVMARQNWIIQGIWMSAYTVSPSLVGGCRPVPLSAYLAKGGWRTERDDQISQSGFRSRLILARPS
jgi:ubiquinone/menaquinone biosynthesis C-methylase UbiE